MSGGCRLDPTNSDFIASPEAMLGQFCAELLGGLVMWVTSLYCQARGRPDDRGEDSHQGSLRTQSGAGCDGLCERLLGRVGKHGLSAGGAGAVDRVRAQSTRARRRGTRARRRGTRARRRYEELHGNAAKAC